MYDQNAMQANKLSLQVKRKRPPANGAIILGPRPLKETMQVHITAMAVQSDCCLFVTQFRATDNTLPGGDGRANKPVKPKKWSQHKKRQGHQLIQNHPRDSQNQVH